MISHAFTTPTTRLLLLASLVIGTTAACQVEILHDIDEPEANSVVAALATRGIHAQKQRVTQGAKATYTISVDRGEAPRAWNALRALNLPRPHQQGIPDVFRDVGLMPTATQERALLRHALAAEITQTLQSIDGIRDARVHVVLPQRDAFTRPDAPHPKARAAVLLKVAGKSPIARDDVRRLVAGSIEGLEADAVNVVIMRADTRSEAPDAEDQIVAAGPFRVTAGSKPALATTAIVGIVLLLGLALGVLLLMHRNRSLRRSLAEKLVAADHRQPDGNLSLLERSLSRNPALRAKSRLE